MRRNLIGAGATRKYLLYAIGEIALVVIGILIALQINNWNEERKNRILEQVILTQLHEEFITNKLELEKVVNENRTIHNNLKNLISLFPIDPFTVNRDTLFYYLLRHNLEGIWTFNPSNSIINSIINNNSFNLLSDDSLKFKILGWHGVLEDYKEDEISVKKHNIDQFQVYFDRNGIWRGREISDTNRVMSALASTEFEGLIHRKIVWLSILYGDSVTAMPELGLLEEHIKAIFELTGLR